MRLDLVAFFEFVQSGAFEFLGFLAGMIMKKFENMKKNTFGEYNEEDIQQLAHLELPTCWVKGTPLGIKTEFVRKNNSGFKSMFFFHIKRVIPPSGDGRIVFAQTHSTNNQSLAKGYVYLFPPLKLNFPPL